MPVKHWMISNREQTTGARGRPMLGKQRGELSFWTANDDAQIDDLNSWSNQSVEKFQTGLVAAANKFPDFSLSENEAQKHVTIFVHGYNNDWADAARRYQTIVNTMFSGDDSLGVCILFTWPSDGDTYAYLPDRQDARASADDLASVLSRLYDWLLAKQVACLDPANRNRRDVTCRAKTSVMAHSMGNYVVQCAMQTVWTRKNQPLLVSLINQLLMVAADVDNDLFRDGEDIGHGDGEGIANLTYRVTALYSGLDSVLGMSAGMKHFGKRRLGRSGLEKKYPLPDNVWDVDCTPYFKPDERNVHSAYFDCSPSSSTYSSGMIALVGPRTTEPASSTSIVVLLLSLTRKGLNGSS